MRDERGVALVTALLVVALATTTAAAMISRQQLDIRRTGNGLQYEQAYLYVNGMERWAARVLRQDGEENDVDHPLEEWATELPPIPVDGGQLAGRLEEHQGRFDLNTLVVGGTVNEQALGRFQRLLTVLELDPALANAVVDWLDADMEPRFPGGAEDPLYLAEEPPYRSANRAMVSVSELRLVYGVDAEVYAQLAPHVTALPTPAPLNVNTVTAEVMQSLADGIDAGLAALLIEGRGEEGYASMDDFLAQSELEDVAMPVEILGVESRYFVVTSSVNFGRVNVTFQSMLERAQNNRTRVVWRSQGGV
ncbi:MAG: type II secretion system minor pseudopilin GspK [Pseudomonadota bacterium]